MINKMVKQLQEVLFLLIVFSSMQTSLHQLEEFILSNLSVFSSCKSYFLFLQFGFGNSGTANFRIKLFSPCFETGSSSVSNMNAGLVLAFVPYSSSNAFLCTNFFAAELKVHQLLPNTIFSENYTFTLLDFQGSLCLKLEVVSGQLVTPWPCRT